MSEFNAEADTSYGGVLDDLELCDVCDHAVDNHDLRAMDGECFECHAYCTRPGFERIASLEKLRAKARPFVTVRLLLSVGYTRYRIRWDNRKAWLVHSYFEGATHAYTDAQLAQDTNLVKAIEANCLWAEVK